MQWEKRPSTRHWRVGYNNWPQSGARGAAHTNCQPGQELLFSRANEYTRHVWCALIHNYGTYLSETALTSTKRLPRKIMIPRAFVKANVESLMRRFVLLSCVNCYERIAAIWLKGEGCIVIWDFQLQPFVIARFSEIMFNKYRIMFNGVFSINIKSFFFVFLINWDCKLCAMWQIFAWLLIWGSASARMKIITLRSLVLHYANDGKKDALLRLILEISFAITIKTLFIAFRN